MAGDEGKCRHMEDIDYRKDIISRREGRVAYKEMTQDNKAYQNALHVIQV